MHFAIVLACHAKFFLPRWSLHLAHSMLSNDLPGSLFLKSCADLGGIIEVFAGGGGGAGGAGGAPGGGGGGGGGGGTAAPFLPTPHHCSL